jgi:hypothetical protein
MRTRYVIATAVLVMLGFSPLVRGQAPAKPDQYQQVSTITLRPPAVPDFEEVTKKLNAARDKTPGAQRVSTYAVNLGGPGSTFIQFTPFEKFADREKWPNANDMLTKVYGQAEATRLVKMFREAVANQRTEVFTYQPDQSTNPTNSDVPPAFLSYQRTELVPEMAGEYANLQRKIKIAQEKSGDKRAIIRRTNTYGTGFSALAITRLSKLSDRDATNPDFGEAMRKAFGDAEAAQLQPIGNKAVRNRQTMLLNYRADLSHPKATAASAN